MNFEYETDTIDEDGIYEEVANQLSVVPFLTNDNEDGVMGARCNFIFKQEEDLALALFSHWGEGSMHEDLAAALKHAEPRYGDIEYYTRMVISYLIKDDILDEEGFGISAVNPNNLGYLEHPILIDRATIRR